MNKHLFIALLASLLLASCTPSAQKKAAEIDRLESEIKESSKMHIADTAKVKRLLNDYRFYAKNFPTDSMTPYYLMKSAKFYDYILLPDSAVTCYNDVYTNFPKFPKANLALFSEAFIYNNEKHDLAKAGALYREYIDKFPNTGLAKSAAVELHNLGKTPEQIMAELDSTSMNHAGTDSTMSPPNTTHNPKASQEPSTVDNTAKRGKDAKNAKVF